jgi:uncharacterized protein
MKWSKFIFRSFHSDSVTLVNTTNEAIVNLPTSEYRSINEFIEANSDKVKNEYETDFQELVDMAFVLEETVDEVTQLRENITRMLSTEDSMKIVLMTTSSCNFNCEYCYEKGIDRFSHMDGETIEALQRYLNLYLNKNNQVTKINLSLFGGEPTLNWAAAEGAIILLNDYCKENNLIFSTDIVTNGYLLDKKKIDFLRDNNLTGIQITLDGTSDVHNKRRSLKNGKPTFNRIISNLHYILESQALKSIFVRINYDNNNVENVPVLLDYLSNEFDTEMISLSFGDITPTVLDSPANSFVEKYLLNDDEMVEHLFLFYSKAKSLGFKIKEFYCPDGYCIAKSNHSFVLYPNGDMYKCLSMVGRKKLSFGNIHQATEMISYYSSDLFLYCSSRNCEFLPVCFSGCRFNSYIKNNNPLSVDCKYDFISKINNELLKLFI